MSKARTKYKQLCQQEDEIDRAEYSQKNAQTNGTKWATRSTNELHEMSDEKYNGTEGLDPHLGQPFIRVRQGWEPITTSIRSTPSTTFLETNVILEREREREREHQKAGRNNSY